MDNPNTTSGFKQPIRGFARRGTYIRSSKIFQHHGGRPSLPAKVSDYRKCVVIKRTINKHDSVKDETIPIPDVSIPGVRKLFDGQIRYGVKILWLIAVIFCAAVCISQLTDRLNTYFSYPVMVDVSVTRNQTIRFPAMTLCPAHFYVDLQHHVEQLKAKICREERNNNTNCLPENIRRWRPTFKELNATFEVLWQEIAMSKLAVHATLPSVMKYDSFIRNNFKTPIKMLQLNTIWGPCLLITLTTQLDYRGPFTYLDININDTLLLRSNLLKNVTIKTQFFLHSDRSNHRHDAFFLVQSNYHGYITNVRISMKEFLVLNRMNSPCLDEHAATTCRNACIDRRLSRRLNCSLPFVKNTDLPSCRTLTEALESVRKAQVFYNRLKTSDCSCGRKCRDKIYNMEMDIFTRSKKADDTQLHLFYRDNLHEIVKEVFTYTFPALLSDISGNLGFFLGVSLLSILEFLEGLVQKGRVAWQEHGKKK